MDELMEGMGSAFEVVLLTLMVQNEIRERMRRWSLYLSLLRLDCSFGRQSNLGWENGSM